MFALEAIVISIAGFILLRIAGKKIAARMTPLEIITTLAIGTIIGHAVAESDLWKTIVTMGIFVGILMVFQFIALKWPKFQSLAIGKPTLVMKDGTIIKPNLTKLRMTVDQLELRFRQHGISNLSDVKTATIEVNGQLGYELIESARPVTRREFEQLLHSLQVKPAESEPKKHDVFEQVRKSSN